MAGVEPVVLTSSYDDVPYGVATHAATHPGRMAAVATLFGASPPPVKSARVLELGCALGGNLIPMAVAYPGATFLGIDLSARQIAEGEQLVSRLALDNIELRHASITDVDDSYGQFDYLICHGVFSWVDADVQEKILDICARNLGPDGVAVVSYNTYPGWHFRGMIREMLLYHSERFADPALRVGAARALLGFLAQASGTAGSYGQILNGELELLSKLPDYYVFHEHLEKHNQPMYFHEFIGRATTKGLQYVGEADPGSMGHFTFPQPVQDVLAQLAGNVVQAEQYMDYLRNRMFRQTLLCKQSVKLSRNLTPAGLAGMSVASAVSESADGEATQFRTAAGEQLTTRDHLLITALQELSREWPQPVPFEDLVADVATARGLDPAQVRSSLGLSLLRLYLSSRLVELQVTPPAFVLDVSARPTASPLARRQADEGFQVTSLRHETLRVGETERHVLVRLDGTRTVTDLVGELLQKATDGSLQLSRDDCPINDPTAARDVLEAAVPQVLQRLARAALLVS